MSDFHQQRLAFVQGLLGNYIHHGVTALRSCHGASWAAKCNNRREMSWSELRRPITPLTLHQPASFCSGRPVSFLASSVLREQRPQPIRDICLTDMMQMHRCDMSTNSLFIHSSESIRIFKEAINAFKLPWRYAPLLQWHNGYLWTNPRFLWGVIRRDLNMSGQSNLKMHHDNDAVWEGETWNFKNCTNLHPIVVEVNDIGWF